MTQEKIPISVDGKGRSILSKMLATAFGMALVTGTTPSYADAMADLQAQITQLVARQTTAAQQQGQTPVGQAGAIDLTQSTINPLAEVANSTKLKSGQAAQSGTAPQLQEIQPDGKAILAEGSIIPAVIIDGINSDLPSDLKAMVTEDVYDSFNGYILLIPKGSVLVAQTSSDVSMGQERMACSFSRIILPDGAYVNLGHMRGSDSQGYSGLDADVNNHFFKQFGAGLLLAFVDYEAAKSSGSTTTTDGTTTQPSMASSVGQVMSDITGRVLDRYKGLKPTLTVEPGTKIKVRVNEDMIMREYAQE